MVLKNSIRIFMVTTMVLCRSRVVKIFYLFFITNILIHSSYERISTMEIADLINPVIDNALHSMPPQKVARYK